MLWIYILLSVWRFRGPEGGIIQDIDKSSNQNLFIGVTLGGIYKTDNKGITWVFLNQEEDSIFYKEIPNIELHPFNPLSESIVVFIAQFERGGEDIFELYITAEGGVSWIRIPIPLSEPAEKNIGLEIIADFVFIGFDNQVLRFNIQNLQFELLENIPQSAFPLNELKAFPLGGVPNIVLSTSDGVYVSDDLGDSWKKLPPMDYILDTVLCTFIFPENSPNLAVAFDKDKGAFYLDTLPDSQWVSSVPSPSYVKGFAFLETEEITLAFGGNTVWKSNNFGESFLQSFSLPPNLNFFINDIESIRETLFLVTTAGVFITDTAGTFLNTINRNIRELITTDITLNPSDPSKVFVSSIGGGAILLENYTLNFSYKNRGFLFPYLNSISYSSQNSSLLYASLMYPALYRTTNEGDQWTFLDTFNVVTLKVHPYLESWVYVGTKNALLYSRNGGNTWNIGEQFSSSVTGIDISLSHPERVVIVTSNDGIYISADTGKSFVSIPPPPSNEGLVEIKFSSPNDSILYVLRESGEIFRTLNLGNNWETLYSNDQVVFIDMNTVEDNDKILYFSTLNYPGILQTLDAGKTFFEFGTGIKDLLTFPSVTSIVLDSREKEKFLYSTTFNGLYVIRDSSFDLNGYSSLDYFTPEGDGINDSIVLNFEATDSSNIGILTVNIRDSVGNIVNSYRTFTASELNLDFSFSFLGYDQNGIQLPPGRYLIEAFSYDGVNNFDTVNIEIELDYITFQTSNPNALSPTHQRRFLITDNKKHLVYVSWVTNPEVYYTYKIKNTNTWVKPINISNSKRRDSKNPACDFNEFQEIGIFYLEENDQGLMVPVFIVIDSIGNVVFKRNFQRNRSSKETFVTRDEEGNFHLVWTENITATNTDIFYRRWNRGGQNLEPIKTVTSSSLPSFYPFVVSDMMGSIYMFYSEGAPGSSYIRVIEGDIFGNWYYDSDTLLFEGEKAQVILSYSNNFDIIRIFDDNLFYSIFIPDSGVVKDTLLYDSGEADLINFSVSSDSFYNLYVVWYEIRNDTGFIKFLSRDPSEQWGDVKTLLKYKGKDPLLSYPFSGDIAYLKIDSIPNRISFIGEEVSQDMEPPVFEITFRPDTVVIGDSGKAVIRSNEILRDDPVVTIEWQGYLDTLKVMQDSINLLLYHVKFSSQGFPFDRVFFRVRGVDLSGNQGETVDTLYTDRKGRFLPEEYVIIWPNPARDERYVHINFYVDVNTEVDISIFSITGRLLLKDRIRAKGGDYRNEYLWEIDDEVSSGVYLVILEAKDPLTGDIKRVIKKVGVVK